MVASCNFPLHDRDVKSISASDLLTTASEPCIKRIPKINPSNVNWDMYSKISVNELRRLPELNHDSSQNHIDIFVKQLTTKLYSVATTCTKRQDTAHVIPAEEIPFKDLLEKSEESLRKYLSGSATMDDWLISKSNVLKENKKINFGKIAEHWHQLIRKNDDKEIWDTINWKGKIESKREIVHDIPTSEELSKHFLSKGNTHDNINMESIPTDNYVHLLDKPITIDEVYNTANLLKDGKSTCDGLCPQMIKSIIVTSYPVITMLFHVIFSCVLFPAEWYITLVAALIKQKGSVTSALNYRPISLVQLLYKWFDFVLLHHFKEWFIPADKQTAYQQGRSCADHIFILRNLMKFAKVCKKKFFICAIDFDGAFNQQEIF